MSYDDVVLKLIEERDSMLDNLRNNMVYTDCVKPQPVDDSGVVTQVEEPKPQQEEPSQQETPQEQTIEEPITTPISEPEPTQPIFI